MDDNSLLKKEYPARLKEAAKWCWNQKIDSKEYEPREVALMYSVDPNELHEAVIQCAIDELAILRDLNRKLGVG